MESSPLTKWQQQPQILKPLCVHVAGLKEYAQTVSMSQLYARLPIGIATHCGISHHLTQSEICGLVRRLSSPHVCLVCMDVSATTSLPLQLAALAPLLT